MKAALIRHQFMVTRLVTCSCKRKDCPPGLGFDKRTCRCTIRLGNLAIYIKYTPVKPSRSQTLLAYGDCGTRPPVQICSGNKLVNYSTKTDGKREPETFSHPLNKKNAPNYDIKYLLTNGHIEVLKAKVGIADSIERRPGGLVIGAGGDCRNFHGFIDEVLVYRCNPKGKASAC